MISPRRFGHERGAGISAMVGETILGIETEKEEGREVAVIHFVTDAAVWVMYHDQNCCESVYLEGGADELPGLVGQRVVAAEVAQNNNHVLPYGNDESTTWTFYKLATGNGVYVTLRWVGMSNGYYSETMTMERFTPDDLAFNEGWVSGRRRKYRDLWQKYQAGRE